MKQIDKRCSLRENFLFFALNVVTLVICLGFPLSAAWAFIEVPGGGKEVEGGEIVVANLDTDPRPDLILITYDTPPGQGEFRFRYKIGWNLGSDGKAERWDTNFVVVDGLNGKVHGISAAIANLDGDSRPELILMVYDSPDGKKDFNFHYKIGWHLGSDGKAESWDTDFTVVDGMGHVGQGTTVLFTNVDDDPHPEMIFIIYDPVDPKGHFRLRYKIGWNVGPDGKAQGWDTTPAVVEDAAAHGTRVGTAIINRDNNPRADIVVMAYDAEHKPDHYHFKIGWNLDASGRVAQWDTAFSTMAGFSLTGEGAGIALVNIDDDPRPDLLVMTFDNSKAVNPFRYDVVRNFGLAQSIHVEMDKLDSVDWPSNQVTRTGAPRSLTSIYSPLGISLATLEDEDNIADLNQGKCYSDAELDAFLATHMNRGPLDANTWHMYAAFVTCHLDPTSRHPQNRINDRLLGIIFDQQERRGIAVFMDQLASSFPQQDFQQYVMRTTAHELGHALCLHHIDGDAHRVTGYTSGRTIMNQSQYLTNDWNYGWSAPVFHRIYNYPRSFWMPRSGIPFMSCRTF